MIFDLIKNHDPKKKKIVQTEILVVSNPMFVALSKNPIMMKMVLSALLL